MTPNQSGNTKKYVISAGHCRHLGATIEKDGVNFAVWCPDAKKIELLLFKYPEDDNPDIITLSSLIYRSTYYWHVKVRGIGAGQLYAWRIRSTRRISKNEQGIVTLNKVLLDPYGKRVIFPKDYQRFQPDDEILALRTCAKSAVVNLDDYDWGLDILPNHPLNRTMIYEMHVKGFTADKSSGLSDSLRGTYKGLIEKIPYLVELGVTAVELLPVFQFDNQDAMPGKHNYWGYCPMAFFTPHEDYSSDKSLMGPINEFRDMVKALHKNGIEVILDVVYNHTSEGDKNGPTYCFKGYDRNNYYIIDNNGNYQNFSGCGNTLNANRPVVRNLILDSLIFWREKMHIDGFRFDLASILTRDSYGTPISDSSTLLEIDTHHHLADTKLIAEPWDAGGLYQLGAISGTKWREWNGQFRDDVRAFIRGDNGTVKRFVLRLLGSPDIYNIKKVDTQKSINFVTCHDGFTLWDLVCYSDKHNEDNGENNRDGNNCNFSSNYGYEGEIDDVETNALRLRQAKNMMALTLLSMGTPMISMGDEVLRTQKGNNNAYCQDNEIGWFNWNHNDRQKEMFAFTKKLIRANFTRQIKRKPRFERRLDNVLRNARLQWHGVKPFQADWSDCSHSIGMLVFLAEHDLYAYAFINSYWEDLTIEIPPVPNHIHHSWYRFIDTSKGLNEDIQTFFIKKRYKPGDKVTVKSRSIVMFVCLSA